MQFKCRVSSNAQSIPNVSTHSNLNTSGAKRQRCSSDLEYDYNVKISSRYDALRSVNDSNETDSPPIKIPPIHVIGKNYSLLFEDVKKITNNFSTKVLKNEIKILFTTIEDFRKFRTFCENERIQYYSYRDPTVKTLSVVCKGIPESLSENEILDELQRLKYPVLKVVRLYSKSREPLQTCVFDLNDSNESKLIYKLDKFMNCIVQVQPRIKSKAPIQCKNCQRFNHSQANCQLQSRCVKCNKSHHYSKCKKSDDSDPICVNCGGPHTANYRGCQAFKDAARPQTQTQKHAINNNRQTETNNQRIQNSVIYNDRSFPPLPQRTMAWSTPPHSHNQHSYQQQQPFDFSKLITNIVTQVIATIMPQIQIQIQNIIQSILLPQTQNGK